MPKNFLTHFGGKKTLKTPIKHFFNKSARNRTPESQLLSSSHIYRAASADSFVEKMASKWIS